MGSLKLYWHFFSIPLLDISMAASASEDSQIHAKQPSKSSCECMRSPWGIKPHCSPPKRWERAPPGPLIKLPHSWYWPWLSLPEALPLLTPLCCPSLLRCLPLLLCQWLMESWKAGTSGCACVTSVLCQVRFTAKGFHAKGTSAADFT